MKLIGSYTSPFVRKISVLLLEKGITFEFINELPYEADNGGHRRPISSSLLAFGGQKDASSNTGTKWGGVRANGGGVSLSYDKGEANGVWASLSGDQLSGKNV
ncbi:cellulose synthase subunit BcsC-related outer membrane protein, partial [Salmonella enterica]|uniref:cellulose synthase subunit BcsC-related outer membrane protein n=1 Tax=Salmonella enterica TaxID=28901 RepID=UPI001F57A3CB